MASRLSGAVVEGGDEREDGSPGIGGSVHVADVNLIQRRLADAEHQGLSFFESYIGGALDELRGDAVGDARQGTNTAGDDDHPIARIGTAGHVGADIGIGLQTGFCGRLAQQIWPTRLLRPASASSSARTRRPLSEAMKFTVLMRHRVRRRAESV